MYNQNNNVASTVMFTQLIGFINKISMKTPELKLYRAEVLDSFTSLNNV